MDDTAAHSQTGAAETGADVAAGKAFRDGPHTIKWVDAHSKRDSAAQAKRLRLTMGEWYAIAVRAMLMLERENRLTVNADAGREDAPYTLDLGSPTPGRVQMIDAPPPMDLEHYERALALAEKIAALRGAALSDAFTVAVMRDVVTVSGLPKVSRPFAPRPRKRVVHQFALPSPERTR